MYKVFNSESVHLGLIFISAPGMTQKAGSPYQIWLVLKPLYSGLLLRMTINTFQQIEFMEGDGTHWMNIHPQFLWTKIILNTLSMNILTFLEFVAIFRFENSLKTILTYFLIKYAWHLSIAWKQMFSPFFKYLLWEVFYSWARVHGYKDLALATES